MMGTGLARFYGALAARGKRWCLVSLQIILGNLMLAIEAFYEGAGCALLIAEGLG